MLREIPAGNDPLNKPVVVSEEALVRARVIVPDADHLHPLPKAGRRGRPNVRASPASASRTSSTNTMQSLIASVYPILKDSLRAGLRADRIDHAWRFPVHPPRCCSRWSVISPTRRPQPLFPLAIGQWPSTFFGLLLLSIARQIYRHPDLPRRW